MILKSCYSDVSSPLTSCLLRCWTLPALTPWTHNAHSLTLWDTQRWLEAAEEEGRGREGRTEGGEWKESVSPFLFLRLRISALSTWSWERLQDRWLNVYRDAQSARKQDKPCGGEVGSHPCWAAHWEWACVCVCLFKLCLLLSAWNHAVRVMVVQSWENTGSGRSIDHHFWRVTDETYECECFLSSHSSGVFCRGHWQLSKKANHWSRTGSHALKQHKSRLTFKIKYTCQQTIIFNLTTTTNWHYEWSQARSKQVWSFTTWHELAEAHEIRGVLCFMLCFFSDMFILKL